MAVDPKKLKTLGKNIKAQRKSCALTQEQLAEMCNLDATYISLLERGQRSPALPTLITLAERLKTNVSKLTEGI